MTTFNFFKSVQNWFGDRGYEIKRSDVLEWCSDDEFLYIHWSPSAPEDNTPSEKEWINWFAYKCMYCECEDECPYEESIFIEKNKGEIE